MHVACMAEGSKSGRPMKALCWHGRYDVRVDDVPEPAIRDPRDTIVKVSTAAICGSDLHLYHGYIPTMKSGDILGHEFFGQVVALGPAVTNLREGDRVLVPFSISCGDCFFCRRELWALCDRSNPNAGLAAKLYGYAPGGLFGYSHLMGGYASGQAEYVRVPFADVGAFTVPDDLSDEQVLFLTDILPTAYMAAENARIQRGDTVAVWGCGPVGQLTIRCASLLGAGRVIAIDHVAERLRLAQACSGAETINFDEVPVLDTLKAMTGGRGPDACIDDVSDRDDVAQMVEAAARHHGAIDILVNNAGIIQVGPVQAMGLPDFEQAMGVMYWGVVYPTLALLPQMLARRHGRIVNITSIGGKVSVPHLLPYCAAKFAAVGFSEGLRAELAGTGVTVTTIAPGLMRTGSALHALVKGRQEAEFAWFTLGASLPLISMDAERAARQIVASVRRGEAERVLTVPATLLAWCHGLFPGATADLLGLINRLALPSADGGAPEAVPAADVDRRLHSPLFTRLTGWTRGAARRFQEHAPA
jgi:threonine dehydrogenase-like Zn-dependent dehydrogenase